MICSFFIPSRKRPEKLHRAIQTIHDTAKGRDFEVLVRIDDDDKESAPTIERWKNEPTVKFFYGQRYPYGELHKTHQPLMDAAKGEWVWIFNDDFEIICAGKKWDELLSDVPLTGFVCQPEIHKLNVSIYPRDPRSCAPCFPNGSWKLVQNRLSSTCDHEMPIGLEAIGWKPHFLTGVTIWHNRNSPEKIIEEHRI